MAGEFGVWSSEVKRAGGQDNEIQSAAVDRIQEGNKCRVYDSAEIMLSWK